MPRTCCVLCHKAFKEGDRVIPSVQAGYTTGLYHAECYMIRCGARNSNYCPKEGERPGYHDGGGKYNSDGLLV